MRRLSIDFLDSLTGLREKGKLALENLHARANIAEESLSLYHAGTDQGNTRFGLFGRDLLTVALMLLEPGFMSSAIRFVCATLGQGDDPKTGEESGRGIHEFSAVTMRGLSTRYNAAEVSLLLLITAAAYWQITGDAATIKAEGKALTVVLDYLRSHLQDGIFLEDPTRCGAKHYALRATYWKDAGLPGRIDPDYPIAYTLVQAQAVAALRAAAILSEPLEIEDNMERLATKAIDRLFTDLWDEASNYPLIGKDSKGRIAGISSDALHMLAYLRRGDLSSERLAGIAAGARRLSTPYGYRSYAPGQAEYAPDSYHLGSIWPYEQFFIAKGALIHSQEEILGCSLRVVQALETLGFPELVYWNGAELAGGGCDVQLWSAAYPQAAYALLCEQKDECKRPFT